MNFLTSLCEILRFLIVYFKNLFMKFKEVGGLNPLKSLCVKAANLAGEVYHDVFHLSVVLKDDLVRLTADT